MDTTNLTKWVNELQGQIDVVKNKAAAVPGDITSLQTAVSALQTAVGNLQDLVIVPGKYQHTVTDEDVTAGTTSISTEAISVLDLSQYDTWIYTTYSSRKESGTEYFIPALSDASFSMLPIYKHSTTFSLVDGALSTMFNTSEAGTTAIITLLGSDIGVIKDNVIEFDYLIIQKKKVVTTTRKKGAKKK